MDNSRRSSRMAEYRRARRKFGLIVYLLTILWMVLGLIQWYLFWHFDDTKDFFIDYYYVSIIFFVLALLLVTLFIFFEKIRFITVLNWIITILIVEFIILGVAALAVRSTGEDILIWFAVVTLLIFVFIVIGSVLPHDLTLDVVILFVLAFIFLIVTVFFIMLYIVALVKYSFFVYAVFISIIVLLFVMYHAQTINGGHFAEMRLNDYLLATLILFHDFIIVYMLTFYKVVYEKDFGDNSTEIATDSYSYTEFTPGNYSYATPPNRSSAKIPRLTQTTTLAPTTIEAL